MKNRIRKISIFSFFILFSFTFNFVNGYTFVSQAPQWEKTCLTVEINHAEGILHMIIEGTKQGDGTINIKNKAGETVYTSTVRCWNERTIIDINLDELQQGSYEVLFKSASLSCSAELVY